MMASGPDEKRPPHILLLMIVLLARLPRFKRNVTEAARQATIFPDPGGRHCRARRRSGGGIRDCSPDRQCGRRQGLPAGSWRWPARSPPWRAARWRRSMWPSSPLLIPDLAFQDAAGKPVKLADFRGRTVLLNLWATWCVPCRKEMPTLDALAGPAGRTRFPGGGGQYRHPRSRQAEALPQGDSASPSSPITPTRAPRPSRTSRRSGAPSACRPRCWSIRMAARSAPSPGPAEWASEDAVKLIQAALGKG